MCKHSVGTRTKLLRFSVMQTAVNLKYDCFEIVATCDQSSRWFGNSLLKTATRKAVLRTKPNSPVTDAKAA